MIWWPPGQVNWYVNTAGRELDEIQLRCGRTVRDRRADAVGQAVALRISQICMRGGEGSFRLALALWQLGNALYPEHVTEGDYPEPVNCFCGPPSSVFRDRP